MNEFISLSKENISDEHICCAFSDKKCRDSYALKKKWLKNEFDHGYTFLRLNERAKVFIEYGEAEKAWVPVDAPNYLLINCFWVSGKYKEQGHGKSLLQSAINDAKQKGKDGLVTVVGTKKFHFMSDGKWFLKQGFVEVAKLDSGFSLLALKLKDSAAIPTFKDSVLSGQCPNKQGLAVYYSSRCPFSEYHVKESLVETAKKRNLSLEIIKLESMVEAQQAPSPATIFSLFYKGEFITTDISVCMDIRFDKMMKGKIEK